MLDFAEWLQATALSESIQSTGWAIPLLQSIHILTIAIVFVSMLTAALRVFGRIRTEQSFNEVWSQFGPALWIGLIVMAATGGLLIVGEPVRQFTSTSFWLKMVLLATAIVSAAAYGRSLRSAAPAAGGDFSGGAKAASLGILLLWSAIIFLGRAIAYDVEVWGSLSITQHL